MLIQITNCCRMACPHCMDDSRTDGGMMDEATFGNAIKLVRENGGMHVTISGGEPSEHPNMLDFCKRCAKEGIGFTICSNGMWLGDAKKELVFERISRLHGFAGVQIYTNPKWYRLHDETVAKYMANSERWSEIGISLEYDCDIRGMKDIGRARSCPEAMKEVEQSKYHNSCLTAHVTAVQVQNMRELLMSLLQQHRFCTPLIDWRGDFHASESWLCQSFGNVNRDSAETLFDNLQKGRPCGGCMLCKRYLAEQTPKMIMVRKLLNQ